MDKTAKSPTKIRYVPSKSLVPVPSSSAQQQRQQYLMNLYNLPTEDEPRPMCGQALISKILKKSDGKKGQNVGLEQHHGLFSMELAADTASDGGSSSNGATTMIPKFIMNITANELKQINKDKARAHSSSKKKNKKKPQQDDDSPSSRTSLTTEDLAQLSSNSPPNSTDSTDGSRINNNKSKRNSSETNQSNSPPRLRVRVQEVNSDIEVPCSLGDNLSSHGSSSIHGDDSDSLVSSMKAVLEEQQKALQEMAAQNHQFKDALVSYNSELLLLREDRLEQKIRMAQLVLQNETFETQSIVLRSEISTLRSMLDAKQDDELRQRFESLLDEDSVYDAELEEKVLRGTASYDSLEDEILKVPSASARIAERTTLGSNKQGDFLDEATDPMSNVVDQLQSVLPQFDQTEEDRDYKVQFKQHGEQSFNDRNRIGGSDGGGGGGDGGIGGGGGVELLEKARRAMSRKVAAQELSPRAVLAPRAVGNHRAADGGSSLRQRQPSPGGAQESIEVSLLDEDDHEDGRTILTAMSTFSASSKSSANVYRDRLGEIKKKRKERSILPALFEGEIGKTYEA
jgi:hypothetical protein